MTRFGLRVPPGFTIMTEACRAYLANGKEPADLRVQVTKALSHLEYWWRASTRHIVLPMTMLIAPWTSLAMTRSDRATEHGEPVLGPHFGHRWQLMPMARADVRVSPPSRQGEARAAATGSVSKSFALLRAFPRGGQSTTVSSLSGAADLAKSTTHRLLAGLEAQGLVERHGNRWLLTWSVVDLGRPVLQRSGGMLADVARPWLVEASAHAAGGAIHLMVREGHDVVVLDRIGGPASRVIPTSIGLRLPTATSAAGRALSSRRPGTPGLVPVPHSSERLGDDLYIRRLPGGTVAYGRGAAIPGFSCAAVPVVVRGHILAALSGTAPTERFDDERMGRLVTWAARQVAADYSSERATAHV